MLWVLIRNAIAGTHIIFYEEIEKYWCFFVKKLPKLELYKLGSRAHLFKALLA